MKDYHSKKIDLIHRLAEFGPDSIDHLVEEAKQLAEKNINRIPIQRLQQLAAKLSHLQDKTRIKIPCIIQGDLFITARFYPSEGQFENESSPDLWIADLQLGEAQRVPKEEETDRFGSDTDHVYLRNDLTPDLAAFSELRECEAEIKALAQEYDVDLYDLTRAIDKIKECKDIDEHYTRVQENREHSS